ncbi:radical SAM protein [Salmonella enterica]|nr:radical SAM protein [Salmonella enterica]EDW4356224.1 radical SAM protein [Salmonella enterica subsp. salamae]HCM1882325.1 radical SAM protein [Salmonella enterica subsp. salamae serovar 60:z10:z39]EAX8454603.1 radical SAM protein [Salmonella enterica]EAX8551918.1 radical SAM protein [Salmonella enterica]
MTGRQDIVVSNDQIQVVVNRQNSRQPRQLYLNLQRFGVRNVHFIPLLEYDRNGNLTADSLYPAEWGQFLNSVFDIWVREDIQRISVRIFDETLQQWCGGRNSADAPLSADCQKCALLRFCRGGCPEHRDSAGKNRLCEGYKAFFNYSSPYMRVMRDLLKQHRSPEELMAMLR